MPALRWLGRRWMTGSDDFVAMGLLWGLAHGTLGVASLILAETIVDDSCLEPPSGATGSGEHRVKGALVLTGIINVILGLSFGFLSFASSRGSVFQTSRRWMVPFALYFLALGTFALLGSTIYAGVVVFHDDDTKWCIDKTKLPAGTTIVSNVLATKTGASHPDPNLPHTHRQDDLLGNSNDVDDIDTSDFQKRGLIIGIQAITVFDFLFPLLSLCIMLLHFDCHGRSDFQSYDSYERVWETRCGVLCCCCVGGSGGEEALLEAARTMAILFRGYDIVPSDIAAAFVLIRSYQKRQFNKRLIGLSGSLSSSTNTNTGNEPTSPLFVTSGGPNSKRVAPSAQLNSKSKLLLSVQARRFHRFTPDQKQVLQELCYYSKYYLAAYGWLLFWYQNLFSGLPRLWASDCTMCCRSRPGIHVGDCCYCNTTALRKVAGVKDDSIIFTHFKNELYYPSFYVAKDDLKKTIVIAIRGTMSLQDCITDVVAAPELMNLQLLEGQEAYVHSGMLKSATNIHDAMYNHLVLDDVLRGHFASHKVVVVGHSLGAGTATILTILLHDRYPELRERIHCYAYAPPGGLLSENLALHSASFVTGCLMGKDLVPRLAAHTMNDLRDSMMRALAATHRTKTTILCHFCCPPVENEDLLPDDVQITAKVAERTRILRDFDSSPVQPRHDHIRMAVKLYPPSQMIHYAKAVTKVPCCEPCICCNTRVYCPSWIDPAELQEILCSPFMVMDHMPDRLYDCIQRTGDEIDSGAIEEYQDATAVALEPHNKKVSFTYEPREIMSNVASGGGGGMGGGGTDTTRSMSTLSATSNNMMGGGSPSSSRAPMQSYDSI